MTESKFDLLEVEIRELFALIKNSRSEGEVSIPYGKFLNMIDRLNTLRAYQWTDVEYRLPEDEFIFALVCGENGEERYIATAYHDEDGWQSYDDKLPGVIKCWREEPERSLRSDDWYDHSEAVPPSVLKQPKLTNFIEEKELPIEGVHKLDKEINLFRELKETEEGGYVNVKTFLVCRLIERLRMLKAFQWKSLEYDQPEDNNTVLILLETEKREGFIEVGEDEVYLAHHSNGVWVHSSTGKVITGATHWISLYDPPYLGDKELLQKDFALLRTLRNKLTTQEYLQGEEELMFE